MDLDLFEFYRFMLGLLAGIYTAIRLAMLGLRWQSSAAASRGNAAVIHHYVAVLLLRTRMRPFLNDLGVIGVLLVVLLLLIRSHWC